MSTRHAGTRGPAPRRRPSRRDRASRCRAGPHRDGGAGRGHDLVAPADRGHHLEVVLEVEQRRERGAHQLLVVGEQQPDHYSPRIAGGGPRHPQPPPSGGGVRLRSCRRPRRPVRAGRPGRCPREPVRPPTPSSLISTDEAEANGAGVAWAWRTTFVRPSRTTQPNSSWWRGRPGRRRSGARRPPRRPVTARARWPVPRPGSPPGSSTPPPGRRPGPAGQFLDFVDLPERPGRIARPSRRARPALTVMVVNEWPSRS